MLTATHVYAVWIHIRRPNHGKLPRVQSLATLAVAFGLALVHVHTGRPDFEGFFVFQNMLLLQLVPPVWLGLHWRGLLPEPCLAGVVRRCAR